MIDQVSQAFFKEMDGIFANILSTSENVKKIKIKNKVTGEVYNNIDYSRIMFDSNLNIYKIDKKTGQVQLIGEDKGFEAFIDS